MISVTRAPVPPKFTSSRAKEKWKLDVVASTLWKMQNEKCCYCEIFIPEKGHAKAVEHYRPKAVFKWQKNDWTNLLLACSQCNGQKSDKFPVQLTDNEIETKIVHLAKAENGNAISQLLIDPSDDTIDPEDHISFVVSSRVEVKEMGLPKARNGSKRGRETIKTIGLDSVNNVKKRRKYLRDTLVPIYHALIDADVDERKHRLRHYKDKFISLMSSGNEYAAFVREFAREHRLDRWVNIPKGA